MAPLPPDLLSSLGKGDFLDRVDSYLQGSSEKDPLYHLLDVEKERALCEEIQSSGLQDPAMARYRRRAHILANILVDEQGGIDPERAGVLLQGFEIGGRIFTTEPDSDELAFRHVCKVLRWLSDDKSAVKKILKFSLPLDSRYFEHLIRVALYLPSNKMLTHADVRKAVLSACFCFLRQSVGSCFATAPAILIHSQQIEYFLNDLDELLSTSRLKRVIEGTEFAIPCSPSWGLGDLKRDVQSLGSLERSPGIRLALEAMNVPLSALKTALTKRKRKRLFVDELFEELLLEEQKLSKERWENFKNGNRFRPRGVALVNPDPQEALCERVEAALRAGKDAFLSIVDHPLLKTWEYTLASFSEVKMEFSRWNLYSSLGMDAKEKGGIGAVLAGVIEETVEEANKKIEDLQKSYEIAFDQVRATEALLRNVSSEQEGRRISAEYQSRVHHMRSLLEMRDNAHRKGTRYAALMEYLFKQYDKQFPEFFQEIYDAEMFDPSLGLYQDSAAGFRLVYKHGRSDPSSWTIIRSAEEYIDALVDFFKMSEPPILSEAEDEIAQKEIPHLTDLVIHHLRTKEFLDSAMRRMKEAHTPQKLSKQAPEMLLGEKKPWAYISGGTMETLLKTYYRSPATIHKEERWVESAEDLLIFLLESLKGISYQAVETFRKEPSFRMLMHSPTHAFSLFPGAPLFCEGWEHDNFTYTWVRDTLALPSKRFYEKNALSLDEAEFLIDCMEEHIPPEAIHAWRKKLPKSEESISIEQLVAAAGPSYLDELDEQLFLLLPVIPGNHWKEHAAKIVQAKFHHLPDTPKRYLSSCDLLEIAKGCFLLSHASLQTRLDVHSTVIGNAIKADLIAPRIVFGDTNWPHFLFAFAWGAASNRLRLFRIEPSGRSAKVMSEWESYLNGSRRMGWAIYTRPEQYS